MKSHDAPWLAWGMKLYLCSPVSVKTCRGSQKLQVHPSPKEKLKRKGALVSTSIVVCSCHGYSTLWLVTMVITFHSPHCYSVAFSVAMVTVLLCCRPLSYSLDCYWLCGRGFRCDWTSSWSCHSGMLQRYWAMRRSVGGA